METRVKVTGFSWHSGGCWCQKETGDSFNSWGEGITAAGGAARRWQREGGATTLTPTPLLPGAAGRQRGSAGKKDTIFADPRSSAGRDPRCPLPMLLSVMSNWRIRPWGWGGEGVFPKKWVSCLNHIPLPAHLRAGRFPRI